MYLNISKLAKEWKAQLRKKTREECGCDAIELPLWKKILCLLMILSIVALIMLAIYFLVSLDSQNDNRRSCSQLISQLVSCLLAYILLPLFFNLIHSKVTVLVDFARVPFLMFSSEFSRFIDEHGLNSSAFVLLSSVLDAKIEESVMMKEKVSKLLSFILPIVTCFLGFLLGLVGADEVTLEVVIELFLLILTCIVWFGIFVTFIHFFIDLAYSRYVTLQQTIVYLNKVNNDDCF